MRKFLCLAAGAALAMTACTDVDDDLCGGGSPVRKGDAISFESSFLQNNNRALSISGDLTTASLKNQKIMVWGDRYIDNDTVIEEKTFAGELLTYNSKDGFWNYAPVSVGDPYKYWEPNKKYNFAAVAPEGVEAEWTGDCIKHRHMVIKNIPVVQQVAKYYIKNKQGVVTAKDSLGTDILMCNKNNMDISNGTVQLTFRHILSRLNIYTYTNLGTPDNQKFPDTLEVRLESMKLYLPNSQAKATYTQASNVGPVTGKDQWKWTGFTNSTESVTNYQVFDLMVGAHSSMDIKTDTLVPICSAPAQAKAKSIKMAKEFFIAPTALEDSTAKQLQLFMDIKYSVGVQETVSQTIVVDGKDVVRKVKKYKALRTFDMKGVKIQDLHTFRQGYQTNLFVCLSEPSSTVPIRFKVDKVDEWDSYTTIESNKETTKVGNDDQNYVDEAGTAFEVSTVTLNNFELRGVLNNMGNRTYRVATYDKNKNVTGTTEKNITYTVQSLKRATDQRSLLPVDTLLKISAWYNDIKCTTQTAATNATAIYNNRYGKFSIKLPATVKSVPAGVYVLAIKSSLGEVIEEDVVVAVDQERK